LRIRAIDLAEVGAGGGSIVAIDSGGSLQVGPQSAGAVPGPVCYDGGGDRPTVTDANLVLGYLNQEYLLGGSLKVYREKAQRTLDETVAKPLGLPLLEAAYAVHMVSNATMARIIRAVTTERGRDIRNFDLIAFGGNGPVHAAELSRSLGIRRIIVPPVPGLFSALGLLVSPLEQEEVQTIMRPTSSLDDAGLERLYAGLEQRVAAALRAEGVDLAKVEYSPMADMRSIDQAHELTVPAPVGLSNGQRVKALEEAFWQEHQQSFGHRSDQDPTEIVNVRLVARYVTERDDLNVNADSLHALYRPSPGKTSRVAYFGRESGSVETPVIARLDLTEQATPGPLIVEEYDTTVVVPPGFSVRRDTLGNILLE
jgi:N-methylhydantoinase A